MNDKARQRSAIITGGARGIGRAIAEALLKDGVSVFLVARSADQVANTVEALSSLGYGRCDGMSADVRDFDQCQDIVSRTEKAFGSADILVNNAGISLPRDQGKPFHAIHPSAIQDVVEINLLGPINMYRASAPMMVDRGFGRVINISTSLPTIRRAFIGPYGATKAALEVVTHIWGQELSGTGVTANVLVPGGMTDTALIPGNNVGNRAEPFAAGKGPLGLEGTNKFLLPAGIMGPPAVWLAGDASAGYSGRRFAARDWDPDMPPAEAAERATQKPSDVPIIM